MEELNWRGVYSDSLKGRIVDEAFSHPAKMAWGLTVRIFQHLFDRGWLKEGDLVADPFGGIGTTGLVASAFGCPCIIVELEQKFVDLAEQNFSLHGEQWEKMGKPMPICIQGDSREFSKIIREAVSSVITSPPFMEMLHQTKDGMLAPHQRAEFGRDEEAASVQAREYGNTLGQIGAMKEGKLEEVVSGIVTSPPWEKTLDRGGPADFHLQRLGPGDVMVKYADVGYGSTNGQIGQEQAETYWHSCMQVYSECLAVLKPGGVMAIVVKAFVRNKQIVDLPSQTLELLEAIGFESLERIRAWMTSPATQKSLMPDIRPDYTKSRKSFFRRLAERKGSPRIDFEQVLIVRKPVSGIGQIQK